MRPSYQSWLPGTAHRWGAVSSSSLHSAAREGAEEVVLVGLHRRRRIHLVAAENQQLAARQNRRRLHRELLLGKQPGHRVGRVKAVPGIGEEIEPQLLAVGVVDRLGRIDQRLALVGQPSEGRRHGHLHRGPRQQRRIEPARHRLAHETDLLPLRPRRRLVLAGEAVLQVDRAPLRTGEVHRRGTLTPALPLSTLAGHGLPLGHPQRRDHRPRRPRQDDAGRRHAAPVRRVRRPRSADRPGDGLDGPGARARDHDPGQERRGALRRRQAEPGRHARPRGLRRRGRARADDGRRGDAVGGRLRGPVAADALCSAQGARGAAARGPVRQQGRPSRRPHQGRP